MNRRGFFSFLAAPIAAGVVAREVMATPKEQSTVTVDLKIGNVHEQIEELQKLDTVLAKAADRSGYLAQEARALTMALTEGRISLDDFEARVGRALRNFHDRSKSA
jgi:hypothetical protein